LVSRIVVDDQRKADHATEIIIEPGLVAKALEIQRDHRGGAAEHRDRDGIGQANSERADIGGKQLGGRIRKVAANSTAALSCCTTGSLCGKNAGAKQRECRIGVEIVPLDQIADRADEDRLDPPPDVGDVQMIVRYRVVLATAHPGASFVHLRRSQCVGPEIGSRR
jgi:hypothetical protein